MTTTEPTSSMPLWAMWRKAGIWRTGRRYSHSSGGAVSASTLQGAAATPAAVQSATTVAPTQIGDVRIEREGNQRWLVTPMTPEQLWPRLQAFWKDSGFVLVLDQAATGIMETDWNENRAKLPQDAVRRTIGRVFDSLYSTG